MSKIYLIKQSSGQSLVELIFSFFIMALVIVAIVGLATVSVRNSSFARNNTQARRYAQETIEWLRERRDNISWNKIHNKGGNFGSAIPVKIYCVPILGSTEENWNQITESTCNTDCEEAPADSINEECVFYREIHLAKTESKDELDAEVVVSWTDEKGYHEVSVLTQFTNWQK